MRKIGLVCLVLLCVYSLGLADNLLTLSDFRTEAKNQSSLIVPSFYSDTVWNSWVNEGCHDLSSYGIVEKLDTVVFVVGTMFYDLNVDLVSLIDLFPLTPEDKRALDLITPGDIGKIAGATGLSVTRYYWTTGKDISAIIGFYPTPAAIDTVLIIYGAQAEYLSSDTDTTNIPYSFRPLITDYVIHRGLFRDGRTALADKYYEKYKNGVQEKLKIKGKHLDYFVIPKEIK